jgi:hypothetical protein
MTGGLYNNVRLNHVTSYVLYLNHHKFLEKKIIQYTLSELKSRHIIKNVSERLFRKMQSDPVTDLELFFDPRTRIELLRNKSCGGRCIIRDSG